MKKDKEWLKKNLERVLYNAELSGLFSTGITSSVNIVYDDVLTLINQLDEPEITEEQALNKLAESYPLSADGINVILQAHIAGYSLPRK